MEILKANYTIYNDLAVLLDNAFNDKKNDSIKRFLSLNEEQTEILHDAVFDCVEDWKEYGEDQYCRDYIEAVKVYDQYGNEYSIDIKIDGIFNHRYNFFESNFLELTAFDDMGDEINLKVKKDIEAAINRRMRVSIHLFD